MSKSYSAMKEVQQAVYNKVITDQALMDKIDGIYDYAPGAECLPYITFGSKTQLPWDALQSNGWEVLLVLDIWTVLSNGGDTHFDILDDICRLFDGPTLTMTSYHNAMCTVEWSTTLEEEQNDIRHTLARLQTFNEPLAA